MKEFILPEKWCIKNDGYKELVDYANNYGAIPPYFITSDLYFHFPSYIGYSNNKCTTSIIIENGYTKITYSQFCEHVLKQKPEKMKKQDFTIEGSVALKKAFIEECGVKVFSSKSIEEDYLCPCGKNELQGTYTIRKLHFNLNTQYGEALEYVKEYFKPEEPEFKVGDLVFISKKDSLDSLCMDGKLDKVVSVSETWLQTECGVSGVHKYEVRHTTPKEIEEYNKTKLPVINGYEGEIIEACDYVKYGCAFLPLSWFKYSCNREIKSMVLNSGIEINEEQMNQIRKVVNDKTK